MGDIQKFEDLIAWQKSRILVKRIYQVTNKGTFSRDFGLRDQIRRASVSVMSNIAEGYERGSAADFQNFLTIAKSSCAEVRSQLYTALDCQYLSESEFKEMMLLAQEVSRIIGGLRLAIQKRRNQE